MAGDLGSNPQAFGADYAHQVLYRLCEIIIDNNIIELDKMADFPVCS